MALTHEVPKLERWAHRILFPPVSLQMQVVYLLLWSGHPCVHLNGQSLHCFLVGVNKSYVISTSDFNCDFIHASNLLPSLPTPLLV